MKDTLFGRISRIITANLDSLITNLEKQNPDAIMLHAINEVEAIIDDVREELGKVLASKHIATKELAHKSQLHEDLTARIEIALEKGEEELAKAGITEQLDIEAQIPIIEKTITDCVEEENTLNSYIQALKAKVNEMKIKMSQLNDIKEENQSNKNTFGPNTKKLENAENTFERIFSNPSNIKSISNKNLEQKAKLQDLERLERDNRIAERLASYKK